MATKFTLIPQRPGTTLAGTAIASRYSVPVTSHVATPDASFGVNILVLTAAKCATDADGNQYVTVAAPINYSTATDIDTLWALIVRQDPATPSGGYSVIFGGSYFFRVTTATNQSPANTECHINFRTSSAGNTSLAGSPSLDQPIAP